MSGDGGWHPVYALRWWQRWRVVWLMRRRHGAAALRAMGDWDLDRLSAEIIRERYGI